jgi:monoamine oxidase
MWGGGIGLASDRVSTLSAYVRQTHHSTPRGEFVPHSDTRSARQRSRRLPTQPQFAGSAGGLERLGVNARPERWLASVARLRPDLPLAPGSARLSTWADDPWARGAYSVHTPGGNDPALAARYGRLVAAGEYTAGPYAALMEGALRSRARAAAQLLDQ